MYLVSSPDVRSDEVTGVGAENHFNSRRLPENHALYIPYIYLLYSMMKSPQGGRG